MTLQPFLALLGTLTESGDLPGAAPGLRQRDGLTVAQLATTHRDALDAMVTAHSARWNAPRHVGATLWWKGYAYWTTVPLALSWAVTGSFPAWTADTLLVRDLGEEEPHMRIGTADEPGVTTDLAALLAGLHGPLIDALADVARAGRRNLWGSVAESLTRPLTAYADLLPPVSPADLLASAGRPVRDLMELDPPRRKTCCLWVTLPDAEACGTCCLTSRPRPVRPVTGALDGAAA
ncbi:(2Fe-2S)-binding protein [Actinocorallia sp. A-T 12471]|uniref:(2Fe-2S)-binding protein n=1 Tax=Actinocorallia sp. A-T 12471 TaxID=3089813 RepID=UPI0029CB1704|nr:(2Fe-2S)-binding protein [Actinocorallia sp. A-T 12471]MDX6740088.1 (2Fe-2S)-binding protein [Actinocorallia sp. A-T 12471]